MRTNHATHARLRNTFCFPLSQFFALQVNNNKNLLPNITLGTEIRDDCGTVNTALEQCLNFVLGALANREQMCPFSRGLPEINKKSLLGGVVGPSYSTTTVQVSSKCNWPFPRSYLLPLQSEYKCKVFLVKISFHLYVK